MAIGRGEWFGVGLGNSILKLFYLPEAHTDFIFAVLAEELGLAGMLLTLGLFLALVWRVLHIAREAADAGLKFQSYMAGAFAIWVGVQALVNIGVNTGVLPTKGLTLPFMSYGRSSLLVALAWVGMVLRIHHEVMVRTRGSASRLAARSRRSGAHERPGAHHGRRHRWTCVSRRWRWRVCCARAASRRDLAGHPARSGGARGACREFPVEWLTVGGLRGKGRGARCWRPWQLLRALWQALSVMRRHRPAVVVGMGGFVTGPGGLAAWLCRRPLLIHEQNAIAGYLESLPRAAGA